MFFQIPNVVGFVLGLVQMVLYCIYRENGKAINEINIVVVNPLALGNGEVPVYPIAEKSVQDEKNNECPVWSEVIAQPMPRIAYIYIFLLLL